VTPASNQRAARPRCAVQYERFSIVRYLLPTHIPITKSSAPNSSGARLQAVLRGRIARERSRDLSRSLRRAALDQCRRVALVQLRSTRPVGGAPKGGLCKAAATAGDPVDPITCATKFCVSLSPPFQFRPWQWQCLCRCDCSPCATGQRPDACPPRRGAEFAAAISQLAPSGIALLERHHGRRALDAGAEGCPCVHELHALVE
jgi:hypothetical protein